MPRLLGEALLKTSVDLAGLDKGLAQADNRIMDTAGAISNVGATLTKAITVPMLGVAAAGTKLATDLDAEMRNIQSVGRQTEIELQDLSDLFVDMSRDIDVTVDSAAGLAAGFYNIQGSGFAGEEALEVLRSATKAASAGLTDTAVSSRALTAVLNSYNLRAEESGRISDLLFKTVDIGVGTFEELAGSVSGVVPTAAQAGVSFEEITAGLATMSKQGFSFSEAAVSLNNLILQFLKPGENFKDLIQEMGFESGLAMLQQLGFAGSVEKFIETTGGAADVTAELLGNMRAQRAVASLGAGDMRMFTGDLEAMGDAAGATTRAFEIQSQSFAIQAKNFRRELEAVSIEVGQEVLPLLKDLLETVKPMIKAFLDLDDAGKKKVLTLAALAAGVGPVLIGVGQLLSLIGSVQAIMVAATGATVSFGAALATVALPAAAVAAVIGAIAVAHDYAKDKAEDYSEVTDTWTQLLEEQVSMGYDAVEVADAYVEAQERVAKGLEDSGLAAELFIDKQKVLNADTDTLNNALADSARSYEDYLEAAKRAGLMTAEEAQAKRDAVDATWEETAAVDSMMGIMPDYEGEMSRIKAALTEQEYEARRLVQADRDLRQAYEDGRISAWQFRAEMEDLNPEMRNARRFAEEAARAEAALAEAEKGTARAVEASLGDQIRVEGRRKKMMQDKLALAQSTFAEMDRLAQEEAAMMETFWQETSTGIRRPLAQLEDELDDHEQAMRDLEAEHQAKMEELRGYDAQVEAERAANWQLSQERQDVLDDLASLEEKHNAKIQELTALGKDKSIETENIKYDLQKGNLEAQLADLDGKWDGYYADQVGALSAHNAEAIALEEQRYTEEMETAHAERVAMLKQQTAEMLVQRTQELVLTGQMSEEQANALVGALASQVGLSVDETDMALMHVLGLYQDWAAGGETTATDIATSIATIDTTMAEFEAAEEERIANLQCQHELLTGAMTDHQAAVAEAFGLMDAGAEEEVPNLAAAMGGLGRDTDMARASMEHLKSAIDALPDEKVINISATYEAPEELMPQSPKLGLQHMLERLVAFAVGNPVDVRAELDGGFGGFGGGAGPGVSRTEIGATTYNVYDRAALELVEDQARRERRAPLGTLMGA